MDSRSVESDFQFIGSTISKIEFKNELLAFDIKNLKRLIDVDYVLPSVIFTDEDGTFGKIEMNVQAWLKEGNKTKTKLSVTATGFYKFTNCPNDETMKKMLSVSGCASLYSIIRSFVMSFTSQSGINGSIILPMINIFKLNEKKQSAIDKKLDAQNK